MRILMAFFVGVFIVPAVLFAWVYFGGYDLSANTPHAPVIMNVMRAALRGGIEAHASGITVPNLKDEKLISQGAEHYAGNCVACHGAPGIEPDEMGKGLMPTASDLSRAAAEWSPAQLYWIIKNGIKSTGMPAWGKTHDDAELWAITAFVSKLPGMTADEYRKIAPPQTMTGSHEHADAAHESEAQGDVPAAKHAVEHHHDHQHHHHAGSGSQR